MEKQHPGPFWMPLCFLNSLNPQTQDIICGLSNALHLNKHCNPCPISHKCIIKKQAEDVANGKLEASFSDYDDLEELLGEQTASKIYNK